MSRLHILSCSNIENAGQNECYDDDEMMIVSIQCCGASFVDGNGSIRDIVTFFVQSPVNHQDQRIINKTINHIHKLYLTHRDTMYKSCLSIKIWIYQNSLSSSLCQVLKGVKILSLKEYILVEN